MYKFDIVDDIVDDLFGEGASMINDNIESYTSNFVKLRLYRNNINSIQILTGIVATIIDEFI